MFMPVAVTPSIGIIVAVCALLVAMPWGIRVIVVWPVRCWMGPCVCLVKTLTMATIAVVLVLCAWMTSCSAVLCRLPREDVSQDS